MTNIVQPTTTNYLLPTGFQFEIPGLINFNSCVQVVSLPSLGIQSPPRVSNPFNQTIVSGDHPEYDNLSVTFLITDDLSSYLDIYNYMIQLSFPDSYTQYASLPSDTINNNEKIFECQPTLTLLDAEKNPKLIINFVDAIPIKISGLTLSSIIDNPSPLTATVIFKYREYTITPIT